jgi:hypothetical protein
MTRDALRHEDPDTVILQMLDSSCFYGKTMDGGRYPPRKLEDGRFHLEGAVTVATADTQQEHFKALRPLLDQIEKHKCLSSLHYHIICSVDAAAMCGTAQT